MSSPPLPPVLALRDAVLALIKAAPIVRTACGARVFDVVPTTGPLAKLPNVSCGPAIRGRGENGGDPLGMLRLRIFVASDEPRRDQAWTIADAIERALEGALPTLPGDYQLIDVLRVTQSGDVIDKISPNEVFVDIATIVQPI